MNRAAVDVDFAAAQRIGPEAIDQGRQRAFENDREIAANCINLPDAENFQAGWVDCQNLAVRGNGSHAFLWASEVIGAPLEADKNLAGMSRFEKALFDNERGKANQTQCVPLLAAVIAGDVENADQSSVRPDDRAGATGQETVVFEEMFATENGNRRFFRERGTDGVGAAQGFVPRCARRQRNAVGATDEIRVANCFEQQAVGVGQNDHAPRFADLVVDVLQNRTTLREQEMAAILLGL